MMVGATKERAVRQVARNRERENTMTKIARFLAGTLLVILAPSLVLAQDENGFLESRSAELERVVEKLDELVDWTTKEKLFLERDKLWKLILFCDPEDFDAHQGLGHRRQKDGSWEPPKERREPRNFGKKKDLETFAEKLDAIVGPYVGSLVDALESGKLAVAEATVAENDVLELDPNNGRLRAYRGEVALDGAWVLKETAIAKERRPAMKDMVRDGYKSAPKPKQAKPDDFDGKLGLPFSSVAEASFVRVAGTGDMDEVARAAQVLHVTQTFFGKALGKEGKFAPDFGVYLLAGGNGEKAAFIANYPGLPDRYRDYLRQLEGSGLQDTDDFVHWAKDDRRRLDALVHFSVGWLLEDAFKITTKEGWAYEGFSLYMTRELVGTRLNWFVLPSKMLDPQADTALRAKLVDSDTNWMNEAHVMLEKEGAPRLADVLKKNVNELTTEDLLLAYVTAAYLLEARFDAVTDLLTKLGGTMPPSQAFPQALGMKIDVVEARIQRWLSERR